MPFYRSLYEKIAIFASTINTLNFLISNIQFWTVEILAFDSVQQMFRK